MPDWLAHAADRAARLLVAHPDFRVLRAVPSLDRLVLPEPVGRVIDAVVLDIETTALDPAQDRIIELALCPVRIDAAGRIVAIGRVHDWLEDPGAPLMPEIARLTGLSDADLYGCRIDDGTVRAMLGGAEAIIAHHAALDVGWIERRYPDLVGKAWCCSMAEIDWRARDYDSRQLGGLLAEAAGLFNTRHRADADVAALVALLATTLPSGITACSEMLRTAMTPTVRIVADGAWFEARRAMKARCYRWNPAIRRWWIEVGEDTVDAERAWLAEEAGCHNPSLRPITWFERHRT